MSVIRGVVHFMAEDEMNSTVAAESVPNLQLRSGVSMKPSPVKSNSSPDGLTILGYIVLITRVSM